MTTHSGLTLRWPVVVVGAVLLIAAGAGAAYLVLRRPPVTAVPGGGSAPPSTPPSGGAAAMSAPIATPGAALPDVVVSISPEAVARAGITVATVSAGGASAARRLPGVVEPNAYRQVVVTPLVGGRITRVFVELGQRVQRGTAMAQVFSPELAEAHTRYTSARAALDAHERELGRAEKLVEIGAASRQELERLHAEHTARIAEVQSTRARLELLGVPVAALDAATGPELRASAEVRAPIDGIVTERLANVGLNVDPASRLFTVVDLTTVWVVAEIYEQDFARVRVGSAAAVTASAYPDLALQGRVSYIDPQVSAQTRTARVRVEVPNPGNQLRLGMYADVQISGVESTAVPMIPRTAVQTVGDRQVVYLADPTQAGTFTEREVRLGPAAGANIEVLSGVRVGDAIVTEGSFFVRAERERLGLRPPAAAPGPPGGAQHRHPQGAKVVVGEQGYAPDRVRLQAGTPAQITIVRTTDKTCGTEVVVPLLGIRRPLPLNEPVIIEFTPAATGEIAFTCGMSMLHGTMVVQ
jgi:RND family efflux transporter MFP subunit